jgi:uncharacterized protein (TIGR00730 family)
MPHQQRPIVAVYGSSAPKEGDADYAQGHALGRLLAEQGFVVATGGYTGAMEAVSRGAKETGGYVIGVTTSIFDATRPGANPYLDEEIKFPTLFQRLHHLVTFADAWISLPGGIGTLSEVALTWSLMQVNEVKHQPFIVVGEMWRKLLQEFCKNGYIEEPFHALLQYAPDVEQALPLLKEAGITS